MRDVKPLLMLGALLTGALALQPGCKEDNTTDDGACAAGEVNCQCLPGDLCNEGLECQAGLCVAIGGDSETVPADTGQDTYPFANPDAGCEPITDATIKADENGWVEACNNRYGLQGVWYPYDDIGDGGGSNITIDFSEAATGKICASGLGGQVRFELYGTYWGAGIGLNLCESGGDSNVTYLISECPFLDPRTNIIGFRMTVSGEILPNESQIGSELRVQFKEFERNESAYLVVPSRGTAEYYFADAEVTYALVDEDTDDTPPGTDPTNLVGLQFQVSTVVAGDTEFDFCISDLEPILGK